MCLSTVVWLSITRIDTQPLQASCSKKQTTLRHLLHYFNLFCVLMLVKCFIYLLKSTFFFFFLMQIMRRSSYKSIMFGLPKSQFNIKANIYIILEKTSLFKFFLDFIIFYCKSSLTGIFVNISVFKHGLYF